MTDYPRNRVRGGTYFFTVNLADRRSDLLVRRIDALRDAVRTVRARAPFHSDGWVVLPEHIHCLSTLPEGDADFSARWQAIKTAFSRRIPSGEHRSASRLGFILPIGPAAGRAGIGTPATEIANEAATRACAAHRVSATGKVMGGAALTHPTRVRIASITARIRCPSAGRRRRSPGQRRS